VSEPLLVIEGLDVRYDGERPLHAIADLHLQLDAGESLGLLGESGSGKTQLLLAILGLAPRAACISGSIRFRGLELTGGAAAAVRGTQIGMVFQDPLQALNPYLTVGTQLTEALREHRGVGWRQARERALKLLLDVQIAEPGRRLAQYPHQLSGGLRQRVLIAMAMIGEPALLLCDEPTTALDVTVQAQVLQLLAQLQAQTGCALMVVTHDLAVLTTLAERVAVMYAGRMVEHAPVGALRAAMHPYTRGLQRSALPPGPAATVWPTITGQPPDLRMLPPGCAFAPRCDRRLQRCAVETPELVARAARRAVACHNPAPVADPSTS
jgi:oligopeptide/dipeptide ABC transporter ATP-binding protein